MLWLIMLFEVDILRFPLCFAFFRGLEWRKGGEAMSFINILSEAQQNACRFS